MELSIAVRNASWLSRYSLCLDNYGTYHSAKVAFQSFYSREWLNPESSSWPVNQGALSRSSLQAETKATSKDL
jgi:hypothetical protein